MLLVLVLLLVMVRLVCLFVCFVGLFHIGNWNFWLVMA